MSSNFFSLPDIADGENKSSSLANCIRNNYRQVKKWAKKNQTNCFRIYDREIKHYPLAIDYYAERFCIHYYATIKEGDEPSEKMQEEVLTALLIVFGAHVKPNNIYWRTRLKKKETRQYEKNGESKEFFNVFEYGCQFSINLVNYLDTGLFLDHRETRRYITKKAQGKKILNLFAYTCSFSVHAAKAGALFTKSVDMSNTYLAWGKNNFLINSLSLEKNELVREDCLKFLDFEIEKGDIYDMIIIDPPTISRSKKMSQFFDIQVDYVFLLTKGLKLLVKGGIIIFSTNSRNFKFDASLFENCKITKISSLLGTSKNLNQTF